MASTSSTTPLPSAPKESAVARLLLAPLSFISFIISLALVDNRNASFRHHLHAPPHAPAPDTLFGRAKNTLHNWTYQPQPYGYVRSPDVLQRQKSGEIVGEQVAKGESWHWNTKQKMMMKMEVADAFEMRKRVVVVMAVVVAVVAALLFWCMRWMYDEIMNYL